MKSKFENCMNFWNFSQFFDSLKIADLELKSANGQLLSGVSVLEPRPGFQLDLSFLTLKRLAGGGGHHHF